MMKAFFGSRGKRVLCPLGLAWIRTGVFRIGEK